MGKNRLEAFSDGVFAILITILVLELKPPQGARWDDLGRIGPELATYLLSFIFLGIYWNNHHHLLHVVEKVNGAILWANLHLLFWLSLVPFVMAWEGEHEMAPLPVAAYAFVQLMAGTAYFILVRALLLHHGPRSRLARAIGPDLKGRISVVIYLLALPLAFFSPILSFLCLFLVAAMWLVPDRRIEEKAHGRGGFGE